MQVTQVGRSHYHLIVSRFAERRDKLQKLARKHIHADIDPKVAARNVMDSEHAYIVDGYLIVYDIATMWWSDTPILAEQLVFALGPVNGFETVTSFLEQRAREEGAKYVCVGTALATSDKALSSLYERQGYQPIAANLAKEIT